MATTSRNTQEKAGFKRGGRFDWILPIRQTRPGPAVDGRRYCARGVIARWPQTSSRSVLALLLRRNTERKDYNQA